MTKQHMTEQRMLRYRLLMNSGFMAIVLVSAMVGCKCHITQLKTVNIKSIVNEIMPSNKFQKNDSVETYLSTNIRMDSLFEIAKERHQNISETNNTKLNTYTAYCLVDSLLSQKVIYGQADMLLDVENEKTRIKVYYDKNFAMLIPQIEVDSTNHFPFSFIIIDYETQLPIMFICERRDNSNYFNNLNSVSKIYLLSKQLQAAAALYFEDLMLKVKYQQSYDSNMNCVTESCYLKSTNEENVNINNITFSQFPDLFKYWGKHYLGDMFLLVPENSRNMYIWNNEPYIDHYSFSEEIKYSSIKYIIRK